MKGFTSTACFLLLVFLSCASPYVRDGAWTPERSDVDGFILTLLGRGDYERALEVCDSLISSGEEDPRVISQKARALVGLGRHEEAVPLFEEAILDDYENCENHIDFATALMKLGKTGRAITEFRVALRFCGGANRVVALKNLAVADIKRGKFREAGEYIDRAIEVNPEDAELLGIKGMLLSGSDPAAAESLFVRSLGTAPDLPETNYQYGALLLRSGRAEKAVRYLERAVEREGNARYILALSDAYVAVGRYRDALNLLQGVGEGIDSEEVLRRKGMALFKLERYSEALEVFKRLPPDRYTMDRMAMCYLKLGEKDRALQWERKALGGSEDWITGLINLSVILASRGEVEEAERTLLRVLELDPDNRVARDNLRRLREGVEKR